MRMAKTSNKGKYAGTAVTLVRTRPASVQPHDVVRAAKLGQAFAKGGASSIYTFEPDLPGGPVAKIYNSAYRASASLRPDEKLLALVVRHHDLVRRLPFVLWPDELVFDRPDVTPANMREALLGFTMPRLPAGTISLYTLLKQARYRSLIEGDGGLRLAVRLAECFAALHAEGIVFCDMNPKNIYVAKDLGQVYFVDADGFQAALAGKPLPSRGVTQGYASPAAIADDAAQRLAVRSSHDDCFVLAILIFQLLVDRVHPFATGPQFVEAPSATPNENITAQRFAVADPARFHPEAGAVELFAKLSPSVRAAFQRSFTGAGPLSASEWATLLRPGPLASVAPAVRSAVSRASAAVSVAGTAVRKARVPSIRLPALPSVPRPSGTKLVGAAIALPMLWSMVVGGNTATTAKPVRKATAPIAKAVKHPGVGSWRTKVVVAPPTSKTVRVAALNPKVATGSPANRARLQVKR